MSKKLLVLRGLPCSGKTIEAFRLEAEEGYKRLSRKSIAELLKNIDRNEDKARVATYSFIQELSYHMTKGDNIVVDDYNTSEAWVELLKNKAAAYGYDFIEKFMPLSISECIERTAVRHLNNPDQYEKIQASTINKFAQKLYQQRKKQREEDSEFVVYGLDDCIADVSERRFYSKKNNFEIDYRKYYDVDYIAMDVINSDIQDMLDEDFSIGYKIVIVSYRPEMLRLATEHWLDNAGINYSMLILRPMVMSGAEEVFKFQAVSDKLDISLCRKVVDDNSHVLEMFKSRGIDTVDCSTMLIRT